MRRGAFGARNVHQFRMRRDVCVDDVGRGREGSRIADTVSRVRVDEVFLRGGRRLGAVVDRRHRARGHAGAAIDALFRMDEEHRRLLELGFVFARVDAIHRADVYACGVFRADAGVGDDEGHCA